MSDEFFQINLLEFRARKTSKNKKNNTPMRFLFSRALQNSHAVGKGSWVLSILKIDFVRNSSYGSVACFSLLSLNKFLKLFLKKNFSNKFFDIKIFF